MVVAPGNDYVRVSGIYDCCRFCSVFFFFQAEDGIRDRDVTGVQTCALPILFSPVLNRLYYAMFSFILRVSAG